MLVRYRLSSQSTLANFQADIDGIIQGTITQVSQLSAPAQANSSFYGTYPSGTYARVNGTSYTYSKVHNNVGTKTHYFRLSYDSTQLASITLAQGYTSGTDTLLNSSVKTVNIQRTVYDSNYPIGIDIVINNKMIYFQAAQSGVQAGIFDIGHNGITRAYTDSMLMSWQDLNGSLNNNIASYVSQMPVMFTTTGGSVPYTYNLDTLSYGSSVTGFSTLIPLKKMISVGGSVALIENPVFMSTPSSGNALNLIYGLYKVPTGALSGVQLYQDASSLYRLSVYDFSLLVD